MSFEVQDPDVPTTTANAYISVADWKSYADDRGYDYTTPGYTDDEIQEAIIRASDYTDGRWIFEGFKYDFEQSTEVPRSEVYSPQGYAITGFPRLFLNGVSEYIKVDLIDGKDLMPNRDNTVTQNRTMLRKKADVVEKEERFSANNTAYQWPVWALPDKLIRKSGLVGTTRRSLTRGN